MTTTRRRLLTLPLAAALPALSRAVPDPLPLPDTPLHLASVHATIVDLSDGTTLFQKHAALAVPIASVTKLMTAVVTLDSGAPLDDWLEILPWERQLDKNAYSRLRIGSEARRSDLLRIALMSSENLASNVLARHHGGGSEAFVDAMNERARQLAMTATTFVDPAGLSPANRSSADDLARLIAAAHSYPDIRAFSTGHQAHVGFRKPRYALGYGNTNPLVASSRWQIELSKTGYLDEAGRCLALVTPVAGRPIAMALLNAFGTRSPLGDAGRIRRWLTTGESGEVAGAARDYEQRVRRRLAL